jgi:hypothetical protein
MNINAEDEGFQSLNTSSINVNHLRRISEANEFTVPTELDLGLEATQDLKNEFKESNGSEINHNYLPDNISERSSILYDQNNFLEPYENNQ